MTAPVHGYRYEHVGGAVAQPMHTGYQYEHTGMVAAPVQGFRYEQAVPVSYVAAEPVQAVGYVAQPSVVGVVPVVGGGAVGGGAVDGYSGRYETRREFVSSPVSYEYPAGGHSYSYSSTGGVGGEAGLESRVYSAVEKAFVQKK